MRKSGVEDLLKVTLVGNRNDLSTCLYNFESVIAGMSHVPDEVTLIEGYSLETAPKIPQYQIRFSNL